MLSEEALERLSERLVDRIEELNLFMINKLGKQINKIGTLTPTQLREVMQSIKYGNDMNEIISKIAEITNKSIKDIYDIFEEVAKKNQTFAKQFYEYKKINFIPYDNNIELKEMVNALAKITADKFTNIAETSSYAILNGNGILEYTKLSEVYQKITDEAILNISMGRDSFEQTMRKVMKELTSKGIQEVNYATGYHRRLDSSIRMNLNDGIKNLSNELQEKFGKEFGADGVEVVHHIYPAPDHSSSEKPGWFDIDGKQFSIEEFDKINNNLNRQVSDLNCKHLKVPIVLGINKPLYTDEQLEADKKANLKGFEFDSEHYTMYEGTQLQRHIETKIRQYEDRQIGAKAINDTDEIYHCQEKINQLRQKYQELHNVSGLPTRIERLRVEGYKKVSIKNANNISNNYIDATKDYLEKATPNSHEIKYDDYFIDDNSIKHPIEGKETVHPIPKSGDEYNMALWLKETFGGDIHIVPRITDISNSGLKVPTPDYRWNNKKWDLKTPTLNGKFETAIERFMKQSKTKKQAEKFIIDFRHFKEKSNDEIIELAMKTLNNPYRGWIEDLILVKGDELIKIFSKAK